MPSFEELSRHYAERLARSSNAQFEARQIAQEVRELVYSSTQARLTIADRQHILQKSYEYLAGLPSYTKSLDNQHYLQLIEWIMSQVS